MVDEVNDGTNVAGNESTPEVNPELVAAQARVAELETEASKLRDESAKKRIAKTAAEKETREALLAKGEFEKVSKAQEKRITELELNVGPAEHWAKYQEGVVAEIEVKIQGLTPEDQELVRGQADTGAQQRLLARLSPPIEPPAAVLSTTAHSGSPKDPIPEKDPDQMTLEELRAHAKAKYAVTAPGSFKTGPWDA